MTIKYRSEWGCEGRLYCAQPPPLPPPPSPSLLCNPFPSSSWWVGPTFPISLLLSAPVMADILPLHAHTPVVLSVVMRYWWGPPEQMFLLPEGQVAVRDTRWILFQSDQVRTPLWQQQ